MARTRQYNSQQVYVAAATMFVKFGYEGCSIDILVTATGLQRGSIYHAFGSKAGLFQESLCELVGQLEKAELKNMSLITDMLIIAMLERAAHDAKVHASVSQAIPLIEVAEHQKIADILHKRLLMRMG